MDKQDQTCTKNQILKIRVESLLNKIFPEIVAIFQFVLFVLFSWTKIRKNVFNCTYNLNMLSHKLSTYFVF